MFLPNQNRNPGFFQPAVAAWIGVAAIVLFELCVWTLRNSEPDRWNDIPRLNLSLPDDAVRVEFESDTGENSILYKFHEAPERLEGAVDQLAFTEGLCGAFIPAGELSTDSPLIDLFYFEYAPGNSRFIHDVYGHAPEVCMRSMGATLQKVHPERIVVIDGSSIPIRVLEFTAPQSNSPLWVFKLTWVPDEAPYSPSGIETSLRKEKIQAGLLANPRPPARVILVGARNYPDEPSAWEAFHKLIVRNLSMDSFGS